jgi:hypothetical protein
MEPGVGDRGGSGGFAKTLSGRQVLVFVHRSNLHEDSGRFISGESIEFASRLVRMTCYVVFSHHFELTASWLCRRRGLQRCESLVPHSAPNRGWIGRCVRYFGRHGDIRTE